MSSFQNRLQGRVDVRYGETFHLFGKIMKHMGRAAYSEVVSKLFSVSSWIVGDEEDVVLSLCCKIRSIGISATISTLFDTNVESCRDLEGRKHLFALYPKLPYLS